jgi:hypothetical protein
MERIPYLYLVNKYCYQGTRVLYLRATSTKISQSMSRLINNSTPNIFSVLSEFLLGVELR